jgi:GT2 family glycosyltransferase
MPPAAYIVPFLHRSETLDTIVSQIGEREDLRLILIEDVAGDARASDHDAAAVVVEHETRRRVLLRNVLPRGYTRSVNAAIAWALEKTAEEMFWIVNDDVRFVRGIPEVARLPKDAGLIGVLSDRAGYQSVAYSLDDSGDYLYPDVAPEVAAERYDRDLERVGARFIPAPLVHGFCFCASRRCLSSIGPLDDRGYGYGYGSDYDLSMRARGACFTNYVYTGAYVEHLGATSAGRIARRIRAIRADHELRKTYGDQYQRAKFQTRQRLTQHLANFTPLTRG